MSEEIVIEKMTLTEKVQRVVQILIMVIPILGTAGLGGALYKLYNNLVDLEVSKKSIVYLQELNNLKIENVKLKRDLNDLEMIIGSTKTNRLLQAFYRIRPEYQFLKKVYEYIQADEHYREQGDATSLSVKVRTAKECAKLLLQYANRVKEQRTEDVFMSLTASRVSFESGVYAIPQGIMREYKELQEKTK